MNNKFIKLLSVFAVAVLGITLSACGNKNNEEKNDGLVYSSTFEKLNVDITNAYINTSKIFDDKIYMLRGKINPTTYEDEGYDILIIDASTKEEKTVNLEFDGFGNGYCRNLRVNKDGSYTLIGMEWPESGNSYIYFFYDFSKDGKLISQNRIENMDEIIGEEEYYISEMVFDKDGDIVFNSDSDIYVISKTGELICKIGGSNWIQGLFCDGEGNAYATFYDDTVGKSVTKQIDKNNKTFGKAIEGIGDGTVVAGDNKDLYILSYNQLFKYDMDKQEKTSLLSWIDVDIEYPDYNSFTVSKDGTFKMINQNYGGEETTYELVTLKKGPASELDRTIIKYGTMYLNWDIKQQIINFNKYNTEYRISVETYEDISDDYEANYNQFNMDVTAGKYDIIELSGNNKLSNVLEDINPYIDRDLNREDYFDNIFRAFEEKGKLYSVIPCVSINTLFAPETFAEKIDKWDIETIIKLREKNLDKSFVEYGTKEGAFYTFVEYSLDKYIDFEAGKCNFETEEFYKTLDFVNTFPLEMSNEDYNEWEEIQNGNILLASGYLYNMDEIEVYEQLFGEPLVIIGYPTEEGGRSVLSAYSSKGIYAKSANKEGAWAFLKTLLEDDYQNSSYINGLPIKKNAFEKRMKEEMEVETYIDENGVEQKQSKGGWGMGDIIIEYYGATQETVDMVRNCMETINAKVTYDEEISKIMSEELQSFYKGQKSAQDVAQIIQSRVSIVLAERK